jgi:hypothetical protein
MHILDPTVAMGFAKDRPSRNAVDEVILFSACDAAAYVACSTAPVKDQGETW